MVARAPIPRNTGRRPDFGVGYILGNTFSVWFGGLPVFLLSTALIFAPVWAFQLWHMDQIFNHPQGLTENDIYLRTGVIWFLMLLCGSLASAIFCYAVVRRLQRQPVSMGTALRQGFSRMPATLGISFVVSLAVGTALVPGVLLQDAAGIPVTIAGVILAIWIMVVWSLAVPATVLERLGVGDSLARSAALTRDYRGSIFGSWLLLGLLVGVVLTPILVAFFKVSPADLHGDGSAVLSKLKTQMWVNLILNVLLFSLQAAGVAVAYFGLRRVKEGVTPDELYKAFE